MSRILRLALLAPDIVEAILGGWADQRVMLQRLEKPLPVRWRSRFTKYGVPWADPGLEQCGFLWSDWDVVNLRQGRLGRWPDWSPRVASFRPCA